MSDVLADLPAFVADSEPWFRGALQALVEQATISPGSSDPAPILAGVEVEPEIRTPPQATQASSGLFCIIPGFCTTILYHFQAMSVLQDASSGDAGKGEEKPGNESRRKHREDFTRLVTSSDVRQYCTLWMCMYGAMTSQYSKPWRIRLLGVSRSLFLVCSLPFWDHYSPFCLTMNNCSVEYRFLSLAKRHWLLPIHVNCVFVRSLIRTFLYIEAPTVNFQRFSTRQGLTTFCTVCIVW